MASQKGSEEKLRREMAQSGASPAEIASKVAQFQIQSAGQQAQAGRSEALSSQLQGQQMGQSALEQGAQLKGQEAGMAGKQAGLAVQQAALKGLADAQNGLAALYRNGWGITADLPMDAEWYRKAAEQGHANAQFLLGSMYHRGS